jgi:RNA polymerase sigma factor (sigma-70 family)
MDRVLRNAESRREYAALVLEQHRQFLWSLSYRVTGNAADADDIVQDTFVRALDSPPADQSRDWRPWLVRVAVNLSRDVVRWRRRREYDGTWLPSPVPTEPVAGPDTDPDARFELEQSMSFAFLLALEVLSPTQRAVLLLRDVFDYSARETGSALGMSAANVRTTHLRARRAMAAHDVSPAIGSRTPLADSSHALEQLLACVAAGDVAGVESLLAADVHALTDGGGEFRANVQPVAGAARVAALLVALAKRSAPPSRVTWAIFNGQAAAIVERPATPGFAPRVVVTADVNAAGRITRIYTVLASRKLTAVSYLLDRVVTNGLRQT